MVAYRKCATFLRGVTEFSPPPSHLCVSFTLPGIFIVFSENLITRTSSCGKPQEAFRRQHNLSSLEGRVGVGVPLSWSWLGVDVPLSWPGGKGGVGKYCSPGQGSLLPEGTWDQKLVYPPGRDLGPETGIPPEWDQRLGHPTLRWDLGPAPPQKGPWTRDSNIPYPVNRQTHWKYYLPAVLVRGRLIYWVGAVGALSRRRSGPAPEIHWDLQIRGSDGAGSTGAFILLYNIF